VFLLPFAWRSLVNEWPLIKPNLLLLSVTGLIGVSVFNTLLYVAGHYTSATNLAILATTGAPVFVLLITAFFTNEKITLFQVTGTIVCVVGILLLLSGGNLLNILAIQLTPGDGWVILAAFLFAIYTVLVKKKPAGMTARGFLMIIFLAGTLFLIPAFIIDNADGQTFIWSWKLAGIFLYLGLGASVAAFLCWNLAIQHMGAVRTALFGNLIPVFSTIEAIVILKEPYHHFIFISLLIIVSGLLLANKGKLGK
jgi:drug/metabolite transporter (DMT)-like permease